MVIDFADEFVKEREISDDLFPYFSLHIKIKHKISLLVILIPSFVQYFSHSKIKNADSIERFRWKVRKDV